MDISPLSRALFMHCCLNNDIEQFLLFYDNIQRKPIALAVG
jgi:hypothetical protein